jgi:RNA polymerase sigma-70 factor (ECF subfamily)
VAESTDCVTGTEPVDDRPVVVHDEVSDLDLVRQAQAGDTHAFGVLVERNRRAVFRAALAALGSSNDADDVAQDAFVMAYRKLDSFRGESAFRTWLLAITWRKALDRRKSLSRWLKLTVAAPDDEGEAANWIEQMPGDRRTQEDELASAQLQRRVKQLIKTLPRKLRDALLLAGSGEYTYEQISHILGAPVGTVKWRVAEARRILKQKMAAVGHPHD